ncbi:nitrite reductase small subunit NirD [Microbacterium sediminis]|uniref:Nitrite reductase small subunit n=1 Tax=Microbacterium sediminis TaxID=904291 RepID=A0A1B9NFA1_9MICO|nr:nitrite reductase small subunit NirD [Microbacterium sediminis]OCG75269.1 nitrite reductase small subunit [Microbacterium sediminis]QBR74287.1 nitrite reductase small subunit NirD [Microbacterium sediminis]
MTIVETRTAAWVRVCALADLELERGRAALIGDVQVALFLLADGSVRAVSNYDPYGGAHVLSRGIVGSKLLADGTEIPTIASPLHKQAWDLRTGMVVETQGKDERSVPVYPVGIEDGTVWVRMREVTS